MTVYQSVLTTISGNLSKEATVQYVYVNRFNSGDQQIENLEEDGRLRSTRSITEVRQSHASSVPFPDELDSVFNFIQRLDV